MARIIGVQRRSPYSGDTVDHRNFDHWINADHFVVNQSGGSVRLFFPNRIHSSESEGVGIEVPADVALAVGHLWIAVATGALSESKGELTKP